MSFWVKAILFWKKITSFWKEKIIPVCRKYGVMANHESSKGYTSLMLNICHLIIYLYLILIYLTLISFSRRHLKESHYKWRKFTHILYHKFDHKDFGSNFLEHEEGLHEAQIVTQQCQAVEHSCPHELAIVESESQDDWHRKHYVHNQVEYVPFTFKIPRCFVFKRVCPFRPNLKPNFIFILNTKICYFLLFIIIFCYYFLLLLFCYWLIWIK